MFRREMRRYLVENAVIPRRNSAVHMVKPRNARGKMRLSFVIFFVPQLWAVQPATGNCTARIWQPDSPQLQNGVLLCV